MKKIKSKKVAPIAYLYPWKSIDDVKLVPEAAAHHRSDHNQPHAVLQAWNQIIDNF